MVAFVQGVTPASVSYLRDILSRLDRAYDYSAWHWQADTPPDLICIGAILVQHTNWSNVEHALDCLRDAGALSLDAIAELPEERLAELVRPAGTPLVKAKRLHALAQLAHDRGGLDVLLATPGIGPETADAILLYAADRPVFEVDAYTIRIFRRLGLGPDQCRTAGSAKPSLATADDYQTWQRWFQDALAPKFPLSLGERGPGGEGRTNLYRRYHALIVLHGKTTCRPRPRCASCCLLDFCPTGQGASNLE